MNSEWSFKIGVEDFDVSLLPPDSRTPGTTAFEEAVSNALAASFKDFGGRARIVVDKASIRVEWTPDENAPEPVERALSVLRSGRMAEGATLLALFLSRQPDDSAILYNLGMALSDLGRLDEAERYLRRAVELAPALVNSRVALGVAQQRRGKTSEATKNLREAVNSEPDNPWALRNLGACLLTTGQIEEAETRLRRATELLPEDQAAWYGLGQALEMRKRPSEAYEVYHKTISLNPHSEIAEKARSALSKIAQGAFRERGHDVERMDAVMYCMAAMEKFDALPDAEVKRITYEIALLGRGGLDVNDSTPTYTLTSMEGSFSGLQLVCYMYVGFKRIEPGLDAGFELSREYEKAQALRAMRGQAQAE